MDVLADLHMHTRFSADGTDEMADMCRAAVEKGLNYICFTDHCEFHPKDDSYKWFDYQIYSDAIERVRDQFGDRIQILKGVEFGQPHLYPREFEKILKMDFDQIIAGIHYIGDDYVGDLIHKVSKERLFDDYYANVLRAVELGGFDILAHFDLPKRYLKKSYEGSQIIAEIIDELVKKEIAIEINTSPLRRGFTESAPDCGILERYIKAGGKRVTLGSDAHNCNDIAADFEYAYKLVKDAGGSLGIFKDRSFVPVMEQEGNG